MLQNHYMAIVQLSSLIGEFILNVTQLKQAQNKTQVEDFSLSTVTIFSAGEAQKVQQILRVYKVITEGHTAISIDVISRSAVNMWYRSFKTFMQLLRFLVKLYV